MVQTKFGIEVRRLLKHLPDFVLLFLCPHVSSRCILAGEESVVEDARTGLFPNSPHGKDSLAVAWCLSPRCLSLVHGSVPLEPLLQQCHEAWGTYMLVTREYDNESCKSEDAFPCDLNPTCLGGISVSGRGFRYNCICQKPHY